MTHGLDADAIPTGWIDCNKTWEQFCDEFPNQERVGMQVAVLDESSQLKQFVIGDLNPSGGECDCCRAFYLYAKVIRYRRIFNFRN